MPAIDPIAWANAQNAASKSILGEDSPPVVSGGSSFYNVNRWTARVAFDNIVKGVKLGNPLTGWMVETAVGAANATRVHNKRINVAVLSEADRRGQNGRNLPKRIRLGGVYHEDWHTKYSCTRNLKISEVYGPLRERWGLIPDPDQNWPKLIGQVLHWGNLIEDIRIERRGCEDHPGAGSVMPDLQDFILKQEGMGKSVSEHRGVEVGPMQAIGGTFRDLGLGYDTPLQREALNKYKTQQPAAWKLVTEGALRPLLDRAINMTREDDLGHWWLAMEVIAEIFKLFPQKTQKQGEPKEQEKPQDQEEQEPQDQEPQEQEPQDQEPQEQEPQEQEPQDQEDQPQGQEQEQEPQDQEEQEPQEQKPRNNHRVFKVGDRAKLKSGPHAGREVEVTDAGVPDPVTGVQQLLFRLVEPD
jgi:hypothetical protein